MAPTKCFKHYMGPGYYGSNYDRAEEHEYHDPEEQFPPEIRGLARRFERLSSAETQTPNHCAKITTAQLVAVRVEMAAMEEAFGKSISELADGYKSLANVYREVEAADAEMAKSKETLRTTLEQLTTGWTKITDVYLDMRVLKREFKKAVQWNDVLPGVTICRDTTADYSPEQKYAFAYERFWFDHPLYRTHSLRRIWEGAGMVKRVVKGRPVFGPEVEPMTMEDAVEPKMTAEDFVQRERANTDIVREQMLEKQRMNAIVGRSRGHTTGILSEVISEVSQ